MVICNDVGKALDMRWPLLAFRRGARVQVAVGSRRVL